MKCADCGKDIKSVEKHCEECGVMLCESCYENREVMLCRDCGREITKFEFDDNRGLCYKCYDESDITICLQCGMEFIRASGKPMICCRCEEV